jgi:hypothetical protein
LKGAQGGWVGGQLHHLTYKLFYWLRQTNVRIDLDLVAGDPFKSEADTFSSDPFASEDMFKDAFGSNSADKSVSRFCCLALLLCFQVRCEPSCALQLYKAMHLALQEKLARNVALSV